jgi:parallel beta-helix repeat protein
MNTLYENNRVENNAAIGITHEISYDAVIRNNAIRGNGFGAKDPDNAGIKINSSSNVEIYANVLDSNASGVILYQRSGAPSGPQGPLSVSNDYVHDNQISMASGYSGLVQVAGDDSYYTTRNIRFQNNAYKLADLNGPDFFWMDDRRTRDQWVGYGQDSGGSFARG